MPLSCSLAMVVLASSTLGADVSHLSASEAPFLEVPLVTLFKLLSKLVFDVVGRALEELLDLEVVALFRAATGVAAWQAAMTMVTGVPWVGSGVNGRGSDGAIEGFEDAKEIRGDGLAVGEVIKYLILIRDETT